MDKPTLTDELSKYENKWVAIFEPEQKIVASGVDAYEAHVDAEKKGYPETTLFYVRAFDKGYIYSML